MNCFKSVWRQRILSGCATSAILLLAIPVVAQDQKAAQPERKRVLILGDSISIGYMSTVRGDLKDVADVFRPLNKNKRPENCAGTKKGVESIDRWLKIDGGNFDVIHFNFGLHDLKRVKPESGKNSTDPNDPRQSEPDQYEKQLRTIVKKLQATKATLIFCTTTPVPKGVRPHRDTTDPEKYNAIAKKIMKEHKIPVNDLYAFANPQLQKIQNKSDVHFSKEGSKVLGHQVARTILQYLEEKNKN